jgi:hypothetical protein
MFQRPLSSSFAAPPDNGAQSSGFWGVTMVEMVS